MALEAEILAQFQMAPVVERVADKLWHRFSPCLEFLAVGGVIARNVLLVHAVGADLAPLVMIAAQPYLGDIVKFSVLVDFLRIDVTVIIDDGHVFGKVVV